MEAVRLAGLRCRIIAADSDPAAAGLYRGDVGVVLPRGDAIEYIDDVVRVCRRHNVDAVLVGSDTELLTLSRAKDRVEMESRAKVLVSPPEVAITCCDKWATAQFFGAHGLRHPRTFLPPGSGEGAFDGQIDFPVIIKPRFGTGSRDVLVIHGMDELAVLLRRVKDPIIQEFIESAEEYTAGLVRTADGQVLGPITMRRELKAGSTYRAWVSDHPDVREAVLRIAEALKPLGPCNVQLRRTEREVLALEINARFSSSTIIKARFGLNEPELTLKTLLLGEPVTQPKLTEGVALRYWNEVYIASETYRKLEAKRECAHPVAEIPPYF
jgi:carbamoyl-phosphate synthase large subunit